MAEQQPLQQIVICQIQQPKNTKSQEPSLPRLTISNTNTKSLLKQRSSSSCNSSYYKRTKSVRLNNNSSVLSAYGQNEQVRKALKGNSFSMNNSYVPDLVRLYNARKAKQEMQKFTNPDTKNESQSLAKRIQFINRSKSVFSKQATNKRNYKTNKNSQYGGSQNTKYLNMLLQQQRRRKQAQIKRIQNQNYKLGKKIMFQKQNMAISKSLKKHQKQFQILRNLARKVKTKVR